MISRGGIAADAEASPGCINLYGTVPAFLVVSPRGVGGDTVLVRIG
jgi:hypothetical protein